MSKAAVIDAVQRLDLDATRRLLESKPSLLTVTDRQGRNLLHLACSTPTAKLGVPGRRQIQLVDFLLDQGFDIDRPMGRDACTPLFFAVQRARNPRLVKALVQRGARPSNAPGGGLFSAAWWGDREIIRILLDAGAKIDIVVGVTPFLASWCWRRFEGAKALAELGANVNYQDSKKGKTALHYGVEREFDPALLKWLVHHGASPDVTDGAGVSPRVKASRKRDKRFLAALE